MYFHGINMTKMSTSTKGPKKKPAYDHFSPKEIPLLTTPIAMYWHKELMAWTLKLHHTNKMPFFLIYKARQIDKGEKE